MGERTDPDDSIDYLIPEVSSPAGGYAVNSLQDYMGLPTVGQVAAGQTVKHSALFQRAYNLIWNEWFRDQNLQDSVVVDKDDGPDPFANYAILNRCKRHDYFTSCLPWPQKGQSVSLPLGSTAPLVSNGTPLAFSTNASGGITGRFELAVGAAINDPVKRGGSWGSNPLAGFITELYCFRSYGHAYFSYYG